MMDTTNKTIGQIVADDFRTAEIFKNAGIDFCCGGKKSVAQACSEKNVSEEKLIQEINELQKSGGISTHNFNEWDVDFLIDYIVNTHHKSGRKLLAQLDGYTKKIADVHGHNHPELFEIAALFDELADDLLPHFEKEEQVLFPAIKEALKSDSPQLKMLIQNAINGMLHEHDGAGELLERINMLSNGYTIPKDACNTYLVTFKMLEELENDLHTHIHLENNILFPKALEMAKAE
ncbi:MAG: iron-sulfur cluster repair di-iron protein [Paludibacteraceae bacterium]